MPVSQLPILLAEDDPMDTYLIRRAFQKAGCQTQIHVVETTQLAIKYLKGEEPYDDRARFQEPALVIMDSNIPGKPYEPLLWIRAQPHLKNLPVVIFSGSENPNHKRNALELGANAYYLKPQNSEQFMEAIKDIAESWLRSDK
jgi:CheY-like chemotaxis protein